LRVRPDPARRRTAGFAKFVSGPEISDERFALAADQLQLLLSRSC
jgi:hypothetical protein